MVAAGCGGGRTDGRPDSLRTVASSDSAIRNPHPAIRTPHSAIRDPRPVLLFLGTSLTAGLGVDQDSAYPALIQRRIDSLGLAWQVINGGLSGETSAGALRRLEWLLNGPVRVLVIETGANDGLRGLDVDSTRANIDAIVARARRHDSTMTIVLTGMEAPPNLGQAFTGRFRALYRDMARRERCPPGSVRRPARIHHDHARLTEMVREPLG